LITKRLVSSINDNGIAVAANKNDLAQRLSERECDVLKLVVQGKDYRAIADKLFLSSNTIRNHIANIYEKLHVSSKAQVINLALEKKWFDK
jgi:DNA-binding NarL/FixJ family response regulator